MKGNYTLVLSLFILFVTACSHDGIVETNYTIKAGQSFGMCAENCFQELTISNQQAILWVDDRGIQSNEDAEVFVKKEVTQDEWEHWKSLVDKEVFLGLENVYGCPDCADGGAEWLEIQSPDINKKVVFEYHNPPAAFGDLVNKLREKRNDMFEE